MFIQSILSQAKSTVSRFARNDGGNIAITFAVALVPLLGFVGAAVDYSRVNAARSAMQAALDSAALMVSKDLSANPTLSAADVTSKATAYFKALYTNTNAGQITVTASYTTNTKDGSTVTVNGSGAVATDFMKMVGFPQMGISSGSTTTWGSTRMRVAMALDVTGSMNDDGKLAAMKTAAKSLIDTLSANARMTEDVYISVIPFAQMVNVGVANKNASWLRWDQLGNCDNNNFSMSKERCTANGRTWTTSTNKNSWKGCVEDRNESYDTTKDAPSGTSTYFPAMFYVQQGTQSCPPQILPMTTAYGSSNVQTIKTMIGDLDASGGTNQLIGMAWAWQMLQTGDPFPTPAKDSNYKYTDAIILLSDGLNTGSRMYGDGTTWTPAIDTRQQILCDNIKAELVDGKRKTVIYTIQVNTDGDPESAVLKYCADSGNFYPTSTASGIATAFTAIGNSLNKLRVSK
ncbi:TadE/TadG family type IV pilus assembly protein [Tardiphaga robiniae]|uniref:Pilus assembly protein TadG n=1 Tax=Tardiphaga robiniae TaxID=943830 RepID=A0A161SPB2_9BRAD|nr:pilus assembly protein TadG-related protein [Tardiphaga robiniae]KZD22582.1 pilus assembly protein TadG [Tardiphaga robiniae]